MKRAVYLVLTTIILASCGGEKKTENKTEELTKLKKERAAIDQKIAKIEAEVSKNNPGKATPVSVMTLQPQSFNSFIEVQASITGDENIYAAPQASGTVTKVLVTPGQRVSKGQTLAILSAADLEQAIQSTQSQLSLAKTLYEKQQKLWAQNIGTQVQLLQAQTQYESLLNQKQAQEAQRNMFKIVAPISGVVDQVDAKVGMMSAPMVNGIRVVSKDKLKASASLGENYLGKVSQNDPVTLVFPDLNDSMRTKISYVAQAVDPISRAFNVEVKLGSNAKLHPNMSCKMKIANYQNSNAIVVPVAVLQKTAQGEMLYVADGNKARSVVVQTGRNANGMVEILGGLKAGDKVITAGFEDLDNGELVAIQ
ncbi:MAG TPA: efflux RND transporter periplasmic adaptor subunit [Flavipsychrobacter sp.]|nr:efflux RND transporter periplasmic adaptor subunit [Flavipsychrobacter sp.]